MKNLFILFLCFVSVETFAQKVPIFARDNKTKYLGIDSIEYYHGSGFACSSLWENLSPKKMVFSEDFQRLDLENNTISNDAIEYIGNGGGVITKESGVGAFIEYHYNSELKIVMATDEKGHRDIVGYDSAEWVSEGEIYTDLKDSIVYQSISGMMIFNGWVSFTKDEIVDAQSWKSYNRIKELEIYSDNKLFGIIRLKDAPYAEFGICDLFLKGQSIKFVVKKVYKGKKYNRLAISLIDFAGGMDWHGKLSIGYSVCR